MNETIQNSIKDIDLSLTEIRKIWSINAVHGAMHSIINDIAYDYIQDKWDTKVNGDFKKWLDDEIKVYLGKLKDRLEKKVYQLYGEVIHVRAWYETSHMIWMDRLDNPKVVFHVDATYTSGPGTVSYVKQDLYVPYYKDGLSESQRLEKKKSHCSTYKKQTVEDVADARKQLNKIEKELDALRRKNLDIKRDFGHIFFEK